MAFPFAIVGFDLDGTLIDSSPDLTAAVNHALALAERPPLAAHQIETMIGGGAKHMLRQALAASGGIDEAAFRPLYKDMLHYYEAHIAGGSRPFPGAIEAVDELRGLGVRVGIVTNKFESLARKLLTELALADRFDCLIGGDTLGTALAKPNPAPIHALIERLGGGRAAFVGDSIYDVQAARGAGIPVIAVRFGFLLGPVEELGADAVIDDFAALIPALERLG